MARKGAGRTQATPKQNGGMPSDLSTDRQSMNSMGSMSGGQQMESRQDYPENSEKHQTEVTLSDEEISARAYQIYENEGRSEGKAMDHWFRAESELRAERSGVRKGAEENRPRSQRQQG